MASIGDIIEVVAKMVMGTSVQIQNVYHLQVANSPADDADILDDMGEYLEDIYAEINPGIPNELVYDEYSAKNISIDFDFGLGSWPTLTNGDSSVQDRMPNQVGPYTNVRTFTPGHMGRKFWPPHTEDTWTESGWLAATMTNVGDASAAAYDAFTSANGNDFQPIILDRTTGGSHLPRELVIPSEAGVQRGRKV